MMLWRFMLSGVRGFEGGWWERWDQWKGREVEGERGGRRERWKEREVEGERGGKGRSKGRETAMCAVVLGWSRYYG